MLIFFTCLLSLDHLFTKYRTYDLKTIHYIIFNKKQRFDTIFFVHFQATVKLKKIIFNLNNQLKIFKHQQVKILRRLDENDKF